MSDDMLWRLTSPRLALVATIQAVVFIAWRIRRTVR